MKNKQKARFEAQEKRRTVPPVVRWEYLCERPASTPMTEMALQSLGRDGWELCANVGQWIFKRPIMDRTPNPELRGGARQSDLVKQEEETHA